MIFKKNFFHPILIATFIVASSEGCSEDWRYQMRGNLSARLSSYTQEKSRNYAQQTHAQFEHSTEFSPSLVAINQLRWTSNSIASDLSTKSTPAKKDIFDTYLGENYLKYKSDNWVVQLGYQEVVWGEAFGFNYADIINPKDQRETLYSEASEARLPLLLFNGKLFFSSGDLSGSMQLLVSPEPRFSKTLPVEIYAGNLIPQNSLTVIKQKSPEIFKTTEVGGKLAASYGGLDLSLFTYSYLSRDPHYSLQSADLTNITVKEEHQKIQSYGLSLAKTIYDFVFRTDIVQTKDRMINYVAETGELLSLPTTSLNTLISLDTPTYNDYSGVLIFAQSTLGEVRTNSFRSKNEQYVIGKLTKNLGSDKTLELSYTHELEHTGQSVQSILSWPVNSSTDLKIGGEFYLGDEQSNLKKLKNVSSIFFSLKNYFQL